MFKSLVVTRRLFVLACMVTLTACGGGGSGSPSVPVQQNVSPVGGEVYEITGAGIKGPLAFATVSVYALNTNFDELYDPTKPVAEGITNAYAEISGLSVSRNAPSDSAPPYVLVVDGTNAIDRNTDTAPVIKKLVTILTRESLAAGQAVYATPYTTLAYQMLRLDVPRFGGNGLQARYFNGLTFSNLAMERIDANINFSWGGGSPGGSINKDKFSARWTGYIEPNFSETYSFHTSTDDGVRLWIDGQLIIDQWHGQAETEFTGTIRLEAGTRYPIVMEYFEDMGGAAAKLSWSSASEAKSIVPKTNLFSGVATSARGTDPLLATKLSSYNQVIVQRLGFGIPAEVNIYTTPPILTKDTASAAQQQLVVYYRAAIEALAAVLNQMSLATDSNIQTDTLIRDLALDYFSDGIFDAAENGAYINGLDIDILLQNPMVLDIPNTQYLVSETPSLILEERAIVGASSDVPFYIDDITFTLYPADLTESTGSTVSSPTTEFGLSTAPAPAPTVTPSSGTVLNVDFDSHPGGAYTKQDAMQDFNANESTEGVVLSNTDVVNDPTGDPLRGKVLRVSHLGNKAGLNGGFYFKARFQAADEYYLSFDVFIPDNYELIAAEKMPGLMYGTLLEASHAYEVLPAPEGVKAFSVMHQLLGAEPYSGLGENKFSSYVYDADVVMRDIIFDTATPETNITSGSNSPNVQTLWRMPKGQWVRIEQRIKQNTATATDGVGDLRDGIIQEWANGQLMVDARRRFRSVNTMHIDGIFMYNYYGGDPTDPINRPSQTQFVYYDNFVVSTSRITR